MEESIFINRSKRAIRVKDFLCAQVITGTDKIRSGFGNGDCIMLDFRNRVFAVADGTERCPQASRYLLERLSRLLTIEAVPGSKEEWLKCMNTIFAEQKYQHKTTLSLIVLSPRLDGFSIYIVQGGDSMVMVVNLKNGDIVYRTNPDMNFAGRSRVIKNIASLDVPESKSRIIIATDGFFDLVKAFGISSQDRLPDILIRKPVHEIPEALSNIIEDSPEEYEYDDIGIIVIDPLCLDEPDMCVIIGGSIPQEEKRFRKSVIPNDSGQWIESGQWEYHNEAFNSAGIHIM